jgi:hypothetical protein
VPSSGSVDFSVNRNEIIGGALRAARILGKDQTPDASHITTGAEALNMIVKQWQAKADFAPGLKVWSRKTAYLFLQSGEHQYDLGPSGDHWTTSYSTTTTSAAKAASATALTLATAIGANSDNIGIELSDGSIGWTTISSGGGTTSPTLAANSLGAASSGARVFTYTSKARRPLEALTVVLRDTDGQDVTLFPMSLDAFESIPDKTSEGTAEYFLYEPMLTNGRISFDREPDDVTKVVRVIFLGTLEDFDAATDTPDYPQEWFRALKFQLAMDLWSEYKDGDPPGLLKVQRDESLSIAQNTNPETSDVYFQPGLEEDVAR